jgi:glutamate transport system permease protein
VQKTLSEEGYGIWTIFVWVAAAYLLLAFVISALFRFLENRMAVAR